MWTTELEHLGEEGCKGDVSERTSAGKGSSPSFKSLIILLLPMKAQPEEAGPLGERT